MLSAVPSEAPQPLTLAETEARLAKAEALLYLMSEAIAGRAEVEDGNLQRGGLTAIGIVSLTADSRSELAEMCKS